MGDAMKVFDLNKMQPQSVNDLYQRTVAQGKNISVARVVARKGATTLNHRHEHEEVIVVLQGSWLFHLPAGDVKLGANQMLSITPGTEHSSEVLEDVVAIDVCTPIREDWLKEQDFNLHTDGGQFLWAV